MKVYIAAPWVCKRDAAGFQLAFEESGFTVVSHWIHHHSAGVATGYLGPSFESTRKEALQDLMDVEQADVLVIYNLVEKSEGKATELGWALARGKAVILVGERSRNIFYYLPQVQVVPNTGAAIRLLKAGQ